MIASLEGVLSHKDGSGAVIVVGGVGYRCLMSTGSLFALGAVGSAVRVETLMQVRADAITLFGFASAEERALFESLTSVSGVGAKFALAILSAYAPTELTKILQTSDTARLTAVSGIGKKTAQRIILELQGSLDTLAGITGIVNPEAGSAAAEATMALEAMGFSPAEIARALADANASALSNTTAVGSVDTSTAEGLREAPSASELIRLALRKLG